MDADVPAWKSQSVSWAPEALELKRELSVQSSWSSTGSITLPVFPRSCPDFGPLVDCEPPLRPRRAVSLCADSVLTRQDSIDEDVTLSAKETPEPSPMSLIDASPAGFLPVTRGAGPIAIRDDADGLLQFLETELNSWAAGSLLHMDRVRQVATNLLVYLLDSAKGGALLIHAPTDELKKLDFELADEGYMMNRLKAKIACHVVENGKRFADELASFTDHGFEDRWPMSHDDPAARGKPKDGGIAISPTGCVRLAAAAFRWDPSRVRLTWPLVGTRHKAALGLASTMAKAVITVRSDSGKIHMLTPSSVAQGIAFSACPHQFNIGRRDHVPVIETRRRIAHRQRSMTNDDPFGMHCAECCD